MSQDERIAVQLGARSYDIVVGSGLLARAGLEIASVLRRPDAIIVTDSNLAGTPHLEALGAESGSRRHRPPLHRPAGRRGDEEHGAARRAAGSAARSGHRPGHHDRGVRRRGGRRSCRICRRHRPARARLRAGADHAARPGRQRDRRQDRHQHPARQEPGRRLPPTAARAGRHRRARRPSRRASCVRAMPKWSNTV